MEVIVKSSIEYVSKNAADIISKLVRENSKAILGLATGSTPVGAYEELIRMHKEEGLDFSAIKTYNLDEYIGLDGDNPNSYRYFMNDKLFNHININMENTYVPDGKVKDINTYCQEYDEMIKEAGGIDLQVLGVGPNGHIAFNEPDQALSVGTCIVDLTEDTIQANSRFFDSIDEVPKSAITMGMGTILRAKKILLLATGKNKANVLKGLLMDKKITTNNPLTFLLLHPDVTVIVDDDAYSLCR